MDNQGSCSASCALSLSRMIPILTGQHGQLILVWLNLVLLPNKQFSYSSYQLSSPIGSFYIRIYCLSKLSFITFCRPQMLSIAIKNFTKGLVTAIPSFMYDTYVTSSHCSRTEQSEISSMQRSELFLPQHLQTASKIDLSNSVILSCNKSIFFCSTFPCQDNHYLF